MTKNILITICLANDMVAPIKKHEAPPHKLHIGYYETVRLLGEDMADGPLIRFLKSTYDTPKSKLGIIHIRDWHDANDDEQKRELEIYGPHCIAGTWGSKFVWEDRHFQLGNKNAPHIVNSKKIMTTLEPTFISTLNQLVGKTPKEKVKIGIIGVLTNIKVQQTVIALQQWMGFDNIAVCSALTASNNIRKHFQGLEDMRNIYGITVLDSIGAFSNWLKVDHKTSLKIRGFDIPKIKAERNTRLGKFDKNVAEYLFRECKSIRIESLKGGYSSSKVFLVRGIDKQGFNEVPNILKTDTRTRIGKERVGFEKVEHVLGPHVPKIVNSIETENGGAIRYSFAMMNKADKPKTFRDFFTELDGSKAEDIEKLEMCLDILFDEILVQLYSNYTLEQRQLWASNTFLNDCEYVSKTLQKILGNQSKNATINIKGIGEFRNPIQFYTRQNILNRMSKGMSYVRQTLAHGDLNAANILLDSKMNMWLIDFFSTDYDHHIVQDIAELECVLKLTLTPLESSDDLRKAVKLETLFMKQTSFSSELPPLPRELASEPHLLKLYVAVKKLREFAYKVSQDEEIQNYFVPLLNYEGYAQTFSQLPKQQKMFTIVSTSLLCEYFEKNHPINN